MFGGHVYICREGTLYTCHLMCELHAKVKRILRECAVPWTAARTRYVFLYCSLRHLEGRVCARRRHVRDCVHAIIRDYMENAHGDMRRGVPTNRLREQLALMELDLVSNGQVSPYYGGRLPQ